MVLPYVMMIWNRPRLETC